MDAAVRHDAPLVVEINQGGQMAVEVLEQAAKAAGAAIKVHTVWAAQGKRTRAEPIALMWEREPPAAHVVGVLPLLEDECCSFVPGGPSPDRMDACVWAAHYLMSGIIDWSESELHAPGQGAAPRRPGGRHRPSFAR